MISWELPDGSEVRYEGYAVELTALREFVLRFMASRSALWDTTRWTEAELARAFEVRFGEKVDVEKVQRPDGMVIHTIRPRLAGSGAF